MAQKSAGRPGCLFRVIRNLLALFLIVGAVDYFLTARALRGEWQFKAPTVTSDMVENAVTRATQKMEERKGIKLDTRLDAQGRDALTRLGNQLAQSAASQVRLEVVDSGYKLSGSSFGAKLFMGIAKASSENSGLGGCWSGSWMAAWPIIRTTCGDGSGRTVWFLMRGFPKDELSLLPLPLGDKKLLEEAKKLSGEATPEQREQAKELATLRFYRASAPEVRP